MNLSFKNFDKKKDYLILLIIKKLGVALSYKFNNKLN